MEVDITVMTAGVSAQRYLIRVRLVAGPLKPYGHVSHVHTITKGTAGGRQRTLTLSVILLYMSGAMSRNMYARLFDRRSLLKASLNVMPERCSPDSRNLTTTRPPGRWYISGTSPPSPMPGPTLDARRTGLGRECDRYGVTGWPEDVRGGGTKPPPVLSVRPRLKPPSSNRGTGNWLSDRGERKISYELRDAAVAGGGIPVELMPGVKKPPGDGVRSRLLMGYDVPMPPEKGPGPLDGYGCDREAGGGILGLGMLENGERPLPVGGGG